MLFVSWNCWRDCGLSKNKFFKSHEVVEILTQINIGVVQGEKSLKLKCKIRKSTCWYG